MKAITRYQADDGTVFNTEKQCLEYEKILQRVNEIMKPLGKMPDDIGFANGGGYLKHDISTVDKAKKELTEFGNKLFKLDCDLYNIGRYMEGHDCLYRAWGRLVAIDNQYREWGQTYFALNPNKGKQVQLN